LVISVVAAAGFVVVERRSANPLLEFGLLRKYPNYLGATLTAPEPDQRAIPSTQSRYRRRGADRSAALVVDPHFVSYLRSVRDASNWGFSAAFLATSILAILGMIIVWRLVRRPSEADAAGDVLSAGEAGQSYEPDSPTAMPELDIADRPEPHR
jgi:hypothetical protein